MGDYIHGVKYHEVNVTGVSLNTGLDSPLECGTGTWDWIIKLDCGTGIVVYWLLNQGTDNRVFLITNLVLNLSLLDV